MIDNSNELSRLRIRISQLEYKIESFKEYDERRKKYYSAIAVKCGELEAFVAELEDSENGKYVKKIKAQREEIKRLNEIIRTNRLCMDATYENKEFERLAQQLKSEKEKNSGYKSEIKELKKKISDLRQSYCTYKSDN